jgi:oxygen-independent coproporphyrinogen-3 oxidase
MDERGNRCGHNGGIPHPPGTRVAAAEHGEHGALGVYVHFPFCRSRCPYCDFATEARSILPHDEYATAVLEELRWRAPEYAGRHLRSIYFGGGTPGLWRADRVVAIIDGVTAACGGRVSDDALEVTLEANPDDVSHMELGALRAGGVNRLSLGIQSLDDAELKTLGRRSDRATAISAIRRARAAGFARLSCDLMSGLPGQTCAQLRVTVDELIQLGPEHISIYHLTLEGNAPLAMKERQGLLRLPDQGLQVEMFEMCRELLAAAGYGHYEVSNFARAGHEAVHNSLYWRGDEYLGLGAAAHSMRALAGGAQIERRANPRELDRYLTVVRTADSRVIEREVLDHDAQRREALWLGLRMLAGISRVDYVRRYGIDPVAVVPEACADLAAQGLLEVTAEHVRLTRRGLLFADEVALRFL